MNYSRRQLEALGEPLGESVTRTKPGGRIYGFGGGGGGGPSSTTVTQSNIPDWLRPQVETVLGKAGEHLFQMREEIDPTTGLKTYVPGPTRTFTPYSASPEDYVAGFSPLQQQVQLNAANLQVPGQFLPASAMAQQAGMGGMGSAQTAYGYGGMGAGYGQQAANIGLQGLGAYGMGQNIAGQAQGLAGQAANMGDLYGYMATSPGVYQQYMSPYQEAVTNAQISAAQRQADIAATQRGAQAARSGAFGGARQAIENAEANRALQSQIGAIQAQGLQNAYQQAQGNILNRAQLDLQGLAGAQQGLGTAIQGGQLGLQGIGQALAGQQAGMQGAQVGLQGVSGAQAGYGLGNQAASNLANIGTQQLAAQTGILGLQNQIGGQQQSQMQNIINQAIQNYAQGQEAPMQALNQFNALLRGYALPGTTATQYQAQPALASQLAGLGTTGIAGLGLYNAMNK